MTGKILDDGANSALILILPIALALVFLFVAWPFVLAVIVFGTAWKIWQRYQWKQWTQQVNPFFNQLIKENRGCLTAVDLSVKANLTGAAAQRFLEKKAEEYGAQKQDYEDKGAVYYFLTASALGSILDDSEPIDSLPEEVFTPLEPAFEELVESDLEVDYSDAELPKIITDVPPQETPLEPSQIQDIVQGNTPDYKQGKQVETNFSLIQTELAKRLQVHPSTIAKRRSEKDFSQWSKGKDPEGIAWEYAQPDKVFYQVQEEQ